MNSAGATQYGPYRLVRLLGRGAMGEVHVAVDTRNGGAVALKVITLASGQTGPALEEARQRFVAEAVHGRRLEHPGIVRVLDAGLEGDRGWIAMEPVAGSDLHRYTQPRRLLPEALVLKVGERVALALAHAHRAGVVHRDVKPGNVFFNSGWHAYLGDFGIAKSTLDLPVGADDQPLTATNMTIGTPDYMAPELFAPKATIDGRVDQYALAVVAYEILAGRRPFIGDSAHIVVEVMTYPTPPLSTARLDLPRSLEQAILKALSKNPGDRFPDCWAFARAALADVPPATDEPGVARLLCPKSDCNNNLKLPTSAAGQKGKCPRCSSQMIIAPDLSALWLVREEANEPITPIDSGRTGGKNRNAPTDLGSIGDRLRQQPSSKRRMLFWAGLLASIIFGAILVSQISTARERLEHSRTAEALRLAEEKNKAFEQEIRNLKAAKAALERENAILKNAEGRRGMAAECRMGDTARRRYTPAGGNVEPTVSRCGRHELVIPQVVCQTGEERRRIRRRNHP